MIKNCNYFVEDTFNKYLNRHHIPNNAFSLLHLNIRSVPANFTSFLSYISNLNHNFSIIGLSETWLKQSNISAYGIDGYSHIGLTRSNAMGGGVSLLISDEFVFCELTEYSMLTEHIECLFAKITNNDFTCIIGIVYRPPNSNISQFIDTMSDILSKISSLPCYILGDYNIDLLKHSSHIQTERFLDIMYSNSLVPMICKPTRETETTATLIDNVFTNNYNITDQFLRGILTTDISDHYIIFHIWDKICPSDDLFQLVRLINDKRIETFKRAVSDTDWSILDQYENCESYFTHFMDMYKTLYDQSFPVVKIKRRYRNRLPWLTVGLKESIKKE